MRTFLFVTQPLHHRPGPVPGFCFVRAAQLPPVAEVKFPQAVGLALVPVEPRVAACLLWPMGAWM